MPGKIVLVRYDLLNSEILNREIIYPEVRLCVRQLRARGHEEISTVVAYC